MCVWKCVFSAVEDTVKAIREAQGLTTLRLSGNSMGVKAAQAIAGGLATQPTLTRALWSNMFVSRVRSEIPPALVTLPVLGISLFPCAVSLSQTSLSEAVMAASAQLVELDLSDNAFGPVGIQAIYQLLTSPSCHTLRVLKLNNTGIGVSGGEVGRELEGAVGDDCATEYSQVPPILSLSPPAPCRSPQSVPRRGMSCRRETTAGGVCAGPQ